MSPLLFASSLLLVACTSRPSEAPSMPEIRLKPQAVLAPSQGTNQIGSSGLPGVRTKILVGDPTRPGLYSILLFVPANTTIPAHSHRDDRIATVLSGTWHFGYGNQFDATRLATLPPGSVYSEPGTTRNNHFAQTGDEPVVVQITGYGPTDTIYVSSDDP